MNKRFIIEYYLKMLFLFRANHIYNQAQKNSAVAEFFI